MGNKAVVYNHKNHDFMFNRACGEGYLKEEYVSSLTNFEEMCHRAILW